MCLVTVLAREDVIKCTGTFVSAYSDAIVVIASRPGEYRLKNNQNALLTEDSLVAFIPDLLV